jgi:outer membrane immunogenic protein
MKKVTFTLSFLVIGVFTLVAQSDRFKAGVFGGVNFTQIDGDRQQGYDRRTPTIGLRSNIIFTKRFDIGTELMYNGRGADPSDADFRQVRIPSARFNMKYADVMLTANWNYNLTEAGYFKSTLTAGVYYGRLLQAASEVYLNQRVDTALTSRLTQDKFKSSDIGIMLGWSFRFTQKIGITIRHSTSLGYFYVNPNYEQLRLRISNQQKNNEYLTLQSYFLSMHVFYDFITPKLKKKKAVKKKAE